MKCWRKKCFECALGISIFIIALGFYLISLFQSKNETLYFPDYKNIADSVAKTLNPAELAELLLLPPDSIINFSTFKKLGNLPVYALKMTDTSLINSWIVLQVSLLKDLGKRFVVSPFSQSGKKFGMQSAEFALSVTIARKFFRKGIIPLGYYFSADSAKPSTDSILVNYFPALIVDTFAVDPLLTKSLLFYDGKFFDPKVFLKSPLDICFVDIDNYLKNRHLLQSLIQSSPKYRKMAVQKAVRIIAAKLWTENFVDTTVKNIVDTLILRRRFVKSNIFLLNNETDFLPCPVDENLNVYIISANPQKTYTFTKIIKKYNENVRFLWLKPTDTLRFSKIKHLKKHKIIVLADTFNTAVKDFVLKLDSLNELVFVLINRQLPANFSPLNFVFSPLNLKLSYFYAAQALFGGITLKTKMIQADTVAGQELEKSRLGFDIPQMLGFDEKKLKKIDTLIAKYIRMGVFPGCQVFVAKDGFVVWNKSYGYHTYQRRQRVRNTDVYDLASVTKVASTTLAAMKMYELGKLDLDKPLGIYFRDTHIEYTRIKPDTLIKRDTLNINRTDDWKRRIADKDTIWLNDSLLLTIDTIIYKLTPRNNIFKLTARMLLEHRSGLPPGLPILKFMLLNPKYLKRVRDYFNHKLNFDTFYLQTKNLRSKIYSPVYVPDTAEIKVAENMYLRNEFFDTLWNNTKQIYVAKKKRYVYSDANMVLLQQTIDTINGYSIDKFVEDNFYKPLGLKNICFRPLAHCDKSGIIPTENDRYWRRQLLQGYVHDPTAALFGGIAGNAGLFSNAYSLGVIGQMLLQKGIYGNKRLLKAATVDTFTVTQPGTFRGLGFDKWRQHYIIASDASPQTYGHIGFTGTCWWIDPENRLVYVFLSNRVHPSARNWKINRYKVRQTVQQVVYEAFMK